MALAFTPHPSALPFLTALVGTGGLTVGIYSFINPIVTARIYGIPVTTPATTLTSPLAPNTTVDTKSTSATTHKPSSTELSLIHALGIRNLTAGLTILCLTSYWQFFLAEGFAAQLVRDQWQRAIGIVILVGTLVPLADAWVCWGHSRDVKAGREAVFEHTDKQNAKSLWDGHEWEREASETGRRAAQLHAARSLVWLTAALWCLVG